MKEVFLTSLPPSNKLPSGGNCCLGTTRAFTESPVALDMKHTIMTWVNQGVRSSISVGGNTLFQLRLCSQSHRNTHRLKPGSCPVHQHSLIRFAIEPFLRALQQQFINFFGFSAFIDRLLGEIQTKTAVLSFLVSFTL